MLGLSGKRRTDRRTVDLADLSTQVSFACAGQISRALAGTSVTGGKAPMDVEQRRDQRK